MSEPPKGRFQFRLRTMLLLALSIGALMYLNATPNLEWEMDVRVGAGRLLPQEEWPEGKYPVEALKSEHYYRISYGFPLRALLHWVQPFSRNAGMQSDVDGFAVGVNGLTGLLGLYLVYFISERGKRPRL